MNYAIIRDKFSTLEDTTHWYRIVEALSLWLKSNVIRRQSQCFYRVKVILFREKNKRERVE